MYSMQRNGAADPSNVSDCATCHGTGHVTRITIQCSDKCRPLLYGMWRGRKNYNEEMRECYGEGIVQKEDIIKINIPAGVGKGMQMTVSGKGNAARRGGINGDLLVVIDEEEHPELIREGNDLIYNLFISIPDAILGAQAEIPTVENNLIIKIDPGIAGKISA